MDPIDDGPVAPVNVRAVFADGSVQPLELTYEGINDGAQHEWLATGPIPVDDPRGAVVKILADMIPAKTTISVLFDLGWEHDAAN